MHRDNKHHRNEQQTDMYLHVANFSTKDLQHGHDNFSKHNRQFPPPELWLAMGIKLPECFAKATQEAQAQTKKKERNTLVLVSNTI